MENEKVYPSQQLICMLPPLALKVMLYLLNWQKFDQIKYYPNQMTKLMHITQEELDLTIQTLENNKLVVISYVDQVWLLSINKEVVKKYFNVTMQQVHDHDGLKMATSVTWNKVEKKEESKAASYEDLSESQIDKLIQRLQIIKNEKEQTKKVVVAMSKPVQNDADDLPF